MNFWLQLVFGLLAGTVFCTLIGAFFGPTWALAAACVWLLIALISHWWLLHRLRLWLKTPDIEKIPDAGGAWGSVLANLYRAQREQERNQEHLAAGLEQFRQAAGAIPDGAMLLDGDDRIEWFNPAASSQFGLDPERDIGTLVTHLIRQPEFGQYVHEEEYHEAILVNSSQGDGRIYSIQLVPFAVGGHLLLSRDVTSSERVETVRRDFVANVSHEMRTPLTVILGLLEHLIADDSGEDEIRHRFLEMLCEQAQRMNRLVEDLLTLSRLEAGSPGLREEVVDVPAMVAELVKDGEAISKGQHHIRTEFSGGDLRGIALDLRSAFGNLINNAVRYSPNGGEITVRWTLEGGLPVFSVADCGIGIAPEHIPRLTERFYRVDKGRSDQTGGTGLGLAIVKHVLLKHQAALQIRSESGQGSMFRAVFPAARRVAENANPLSSRVA